ncbi:MAG: serine acetyltransferase [Myxococcales bacterium]|nr:serine acetyltransferase [Myxococcales bacterium]
MSECECGDRTLDEAVEAVLESYRGDPRGQRIGRRFLPSRDAVVEIVRLFFEVFYPGYFGRHDLTASNLRYHVGTLLSTLRQKLSHQIEQCLCFEFEGELSTSDAGRCASHATRLAGMLVGRIPEIRHQLIEDIQAAFDGDPAAQSLDEVVLAYPGLLAITVHRVAHEMYAMGIPLMPRIMSEWAHSRSGADIHPGAEIGRHFFIDHATGVVIGETSRIGAGVKLYQGVTLGAISHPRDAEGRVIRNTRRHPTVDDQVTLYANATVLGGTTVIGAGSTVGGSVFITKSIPPGSKVAVKPPELRVVRPGSTPGDDDDLWSNYEI